MGLYLVEARIERPHVSGPARAQLCRVSAPQRPRVAMSRGAAPPAAPAPVNISPPVVSGLVRIGETLTATDGVWSDATGWARQWTRDGVAIGGETSSTYVAVAADIAALIGCEVTATGPGGVSSPVASNTVASPWRPILAAKPGVLIWDGLDPQCYGGAAVGAPVADLYTVDGILLASQPLTARQATRAVDHLDCDGGDDVYTGTPALVTYWQASCTYGMGADGLTGASGEAALEAKGAGATPYHLAYIAGGANTARNYHRTSDAGAFMLGLPGSSQDSAVVWTSGTPGAGALYDLASGVTSVLTVAPASLPTKTYTQWSIGGNVAGTLGWAGNVRYFVLDDTAWSSGDLALWRACAVAAGVL